MRCIGPALKGELTPAMVRLLCAHSATRCVMGCATVTMPLWWARSSATRGARCRSALRAGAYSQSRFGPCCVCCDSRARVAFRGSLVSVYRTPCQPAR